MKKPVLIIFGFCITIALVIGMFNYIVILELKDDTAKNLSMLEIADEELAKNISKIKITGEELEVRTDVLEKQQQNLLNEEYDFLVSIRQNMTTPKYYVVKSGTTGIEELKTTRLSEAVYYTLNFSKIVIMQRGIYELDSNVELDSKSNVILDGQGSILNLNGYHISFTSDNYAENSNNQIKNFVMRNGTFSLENSFRVTIENMIFQDCESAIEIANTNTWSEASKLENIYWENCHAALTFKTPSGNATSSYENTALDRCYINLYQNNSFGIIVEKGAQVSSSQWTNMRIWMHANQTQAQTGLHLDGIMSDTLLSDVVFESFDNGTIYGIYLGPNSNTTGFSLGEGTSFLGTFNARVKNDEGKWVYGVTSVFKQEEQVPLGKNSSVIQRYPLTIGSFEAFIKIENLSEGEEVNVTINLNFIDHTKNSIPLPTFRNNTTYWLSKQDLYDLYPPQNIIWNIETTAQTNRIISQTKVTIGVIGTAS